MAGSEREYLRIPRDATFPTLYWPTYFQDYAHAYFFGAKELWEKTGKDQYGGVPFPPDLVYPILFLVYHFLELELKSAVELTNSIGKITTEISEVQNFHGHDLNNLLSLLKANLNKLDGILVVLPPTEPTCQLIEDMAKFGMLSESLRYPIRTASKKAREKAIPEERLDGLIPDAATVIEAAEKAWEDFDGLISHLILYEFYFSERCQ